MDIDGDEAAKVPYAVAILLHGKRTEFSCSNERNTVIEEAIENCAMLSNNASSAAQSGYLVQEFFNSTASSIVSEIVERFDAVTQECSSIQSGSSSITVCEVLLAIIHP